MVMLPVPALPTWRPSQRIRMLGTADEACVGVTSVYRLIALVPGRRETRACRLGTRYPDLDGQTLVTTYQRFRTGEWPPQLLPLWDWGDTMWSCVDVAEGFAVVTHDGSGATRTTFTLQSFLGGWLDGMDLFAALYEIEDAVMSNPFTGKPIPRRKVGKAIGAPIDRR